MKGLFLAIFVPIVFILGTPSLIATIMYDGSGDDNMPTYLYVDDADALAMLYEELNDSIADVESNVTSDMVFNLHQDIINTAIFQAIRSEDMNPNYMPTDDCNDDSCNYIFAEPIPIEGLDIKLRVVGAWVDFAEGQLITNIFLELQLNDGFTYKTNFQTFFNVSDLPDKYVIEFDKIKLGNLPIPQALITTIINTLDNQIDQIDFEEQTADVKVGDLDVANMSYSVMKDELIDQIKTSDNSENDAPNLLAKEVLSIIFDNQLINFSFEEEEFVLTAAVSKFRSNDGTDIPDYLYDLHYQEEVEGEMVIGDFDPNSLDPDTFIPNLFSDFTENNASGGSYLISESSVNQLIYFTAKGFEESRVSKPIPNNTGEEKMIELGLKAIWFEIAPGEIYATALFNIGGIESLLQIRAEEVLATDQELVFEFTEISFGKDSGENDGDYLSILDLDAFKQVFAGLGDVEFGEFNADGSLTISIDKLSSLIENSSYTISGISLVQDGILINVVPSTPQ
ncbi:MAG: hypothetical protein JXR62_03130 [Bacilli bacterium]|nr:hypothetical protein [Bacilli bacterium]